MTNTSTTLPTIDQLLAASSASKEFAAALRALAEGRDPGEPIRFQRGCPPTKVRRTVCWLLESRPQLDIRSVEVEATSGCSDFRGTLAVRTGDAELRFRFVWDCAWRAAEAGMKTFWGDPDQQKAAREFDYRCFETFEELPA